VPAPAGDAKRPGVVALRARLLGPFFITVGDKKVGPWARPPAKRLLELLLISPGRRTGRGAACEALFPYLGPAAAARELSKALSMARGALSPLGEEAAGLIQADRAHIWADPATPLEVDLELLEESLRSALRTEPGLERDSQLVLALAEEGTLLEDEPVAEWAVRPRERLEWARQEARLALARDRTRGKGRSEPEAVIEAWAGSLAHDPTSEEAASALMRVYGAQRRHALVEATYERCRTALEELGLHISPALKEVHEATTAATDFPPRPEGPLPPTPVRYREERRLVSVLFVELSGPVGIGQRLDPEDLRQVVGGALVGVIAKVEWLGGTVTSVSGAGLAALFGAPKSHEDDPERALRAAFGAVSGAGDCAEGLSVRAGIETGQAVVGPIGGASTSHYGALGEVVGVAAGLQSVAKAGSVLVGPVTRSATEGLFEWGPTEDVAISPGAKPLVGSYLERPKPRPLGQAGRRGLARGAPLMGRRTELAVLHDVLREATAGKGGVVLIAGEPGLGKTRLVHECRRLFMAWVGAASGRLPLWLEARAASYASSRPYGLYQQLLTAWVGVVPEEGEDVVRPALERAMKAVFPGKAVDDRVSPLSRVMGLGPGKAAADRVRLTPEQLQRATFEAVRALVSRLVAAGPTVLVLEDLHWADPTSLHLTEELSSLTKQGPLLLVLTHRPEPDPGVPALEAALGADRDLRVRRLELSPLGRGAERDLARALLGDGTSDEVVDAVSQGAEGNPLFMEERLASLLETRALVGGETGWHLDHGAPGELPAALERLVRSRVDRLGPGPRDALVAASVLGPEFALGALGTVTDLDDGLIVAVSQLCSAGLLVELRKLPEPTYRFRHALLQEAAYKGLLRAERRRLHARAAWGLEEASAGRLEEVAGVLGHHYALADEIERAAHYLELAGDRAVSAFANDEARASYHWVLELLGAEPAKQVQAAALWLKLGRLAWRLGRFDESRTAFEEAARCAGTDAVVLGARALCLLGAVETAGHRHQAARAALEAAEGKLQSCPDKDADDWAEAWIDVQLQRSTLHYWRNEPDAQAVLPAPLNGNGLAALSEDCSA
jgi:DNA-binding SARP family transcriptional activator